MEEMILTIYELPDNLIPILIEKFKLNLGDIIILKERDYVKYILTENGKYERCYTDNTFYFPKCLNFPEFPPHYWGYEEHMEFNPILNPIIKSGCVIGRFNEKYKLYPIQDVNFNHILFLGYEAELLEYDEID